MDYLKLPLSFESFFEKSSMPSCNMESSIMRFLHLLITTVQEEYEQDLNFGLAFWDDDFSTHIQSDGQKEQIVQQIKAQIAKYEPRLADVDVRVLMKTELLHYSAIKAEKRRLEITINAKLTRSNAPFLFQTALFIGPMDLD